MNINKKSEVENVMLQISSGKFYNTNNLHVNDGKGIFYSNYSWHGSIETCVGTLDAVDTHGEITSYVLNYKNKIEKGGLLVKVGDSEIVKQFRLLFSFFFQSFSDSDRNVVELHCRNTKRNMNDEFLPTDFVNRIFDSKIYGTDQEVKKFQEFMRRIIGLERSKYKKLIQCINALNNSLIALNYNFELAYSLLIYCLESLSQSFDNYEPEWEDYSQIIRLKLDTVLSEIKIEKAEEIKEILLSDSHLKLQKRFVNFISSNITESFFIEDAIESNSPLRKSDLNQVLLNAYAIRSKYVHSLQSIMKQLKMPDIGASEVYIWGNNPYLTYKGLMRLTHHVLKNFFENQNFVEKEEYDWNLDLPGTVQVELSEDYWLHKFEGFKQEHSTQKLNGFLSQLQRAFLYNQPFTDLTKLMKVYEDLIPQSKQTYKIKMIANYTLYNLHLTEKLRLPNYEMVIDKYCEMLNLPSIEGLLTNVLVGETFVFTTSECEELFIKYERKKYNSSSINIPMYIEFIIMVHIVNSFHSEGTNEKYVHWLDKCILHLAGNYKLQKYLLGVKESNSQIDLNYLTSNNFLIFNSQSSTLSE
ncbi:hypothetical protein ABEX38_29130 [Priestia megaterium]